jgi:hypothetical protein
MSAMLGDLLVAPPVLVTPGNLLVARPVSVMLDLAVQQLDFVEPPPADKWLHGDGGCQ